MPIRAPALVLSMIISGLLISCSYAGLHAGFQKGDLYIIVLNYYRQKICESPKILRKSSCK